MQSFGKDADRRTSRFYRYATCALKLGIALLVLNYIAKRQWACRMDDGAERTIVQQSLAEELGAKVRVFCIILTEGWRHEDLAAHVHRTWARHCNRVLFVSDEEHGEIEPVVFKYKHKWARLKAGLSYVHRYHFDEADWFLKAQDDNYVVLENLRYLLHRYPPEMPIYFGCQLRDTSNQTYMYGESGYVLSKEALHRFVTLALPNETLCRPEPDGGEDIEMGKCVRNVGVSPGDSRDINGSHTFFPFELDDYMAADSLDTEKYNWYFEHAPTEMEDDFVMSGSRAAPTDHLSRHAISFPHVPIPTMHSIEYFIYKLRLFGTAPKEATRPPPLAFNQAVNATDGSSEQQDLK